jgi:hypothetical protein
MGAALLAGTATGVYPDLATAVSRTLRFSGHIEPFPDDVAAYGGGIQPEGRYAGFPSVLQDMPQSLRSFGMT